MFLWTVWPAYLTKTRNRPNTSHFNTSALILSNFSIKIYRKLTENENCGNRSESYPTFLDDFTSILACKWLIKTLTLLPLSCHCYCYSFKIFSHTTSNSGSILGCSGQRQDDSRIIKISGNTTFLSTLWFQTFYLTKFLSVEKTKCLLF